MCHAYSLIIEGLHYRRGSGVNVAIMLGTIANLMRKSPESEIKAKFFADIGEKCGKTLANNPADFRPFISRKSDRENSRKRNPLHIFSATHSVAPYCAIPQEYLSDTPLLHAMGFLVSQHGQLGAIPPPPFLSVFPL